LPLLVVGALVLAGCASGPGTGPQTPANGEVAPPPTLTDAAFAPAAHRILLANDRNGETKQLLASVVQHQLKRAEALYDLGYPAAAEAAASGALLLLRRDDNVASALHGQSQTLLLSANAAARRGNAGRARALYQLTKSANRDPAVEAQINRHLTALDDFTRSTIGTSPVIRTGEASREKLAAAWVDPSNEAFTAAQASVIAWMETALESQVAEGGPTSRGERDDAMEAYRAVRSGAPALIALGLRQGDPLSAVKALDDADLSRALPPGVRLRLEAAGESGSPEAYLDLFRLFDGVRREGDVETSLPPHVADGATLWATIGLYRSSPGRLEHAMPLAMSLVEYGMPEVATTLLAQNVDQRTSAEALGWSLSLVLRGLIELSQTEQTSAAERSVAEAEPLLRLAEEARYSEVRPEPARVYSLLASIEIRTGALDRALPLLKKAVEHTPTADTLVRLASLERQRGELDGALATLKRAILVAQKSGDVLIEAHAEELSFQLERDRGNTAEARAALGRALERTLTARALDLAVVPPAAVERLFARILEHYGDMRGSRRAYERALSASRGHSIEIEVTLTEMARGALTTGDVRLARLATRSALDLGLAPKDLIYIALWQKLTEQRAGASSDGLPSQIFTSATDTTGWNAQLQKFALGELDGRGLNEAARTLPERTEADFYQALAIRVPAAAPAEVAAALLRVADSQALDLIEVKIARDLLAPAQKFALPDGVTVP